MTVTIHGVYRSRASRNFWLAGEIGLAVTVVPVIQAYRLPDPAAPMRRSTPGRPPFWR